MKQIFEPYWKWEDFQHGMYTPPTAADADSLRVRATTLLSNANAFGETCRQMIAAWPVATAVNLTNPHTNRRAWMGQAACCYAFNVPEIVTRDAWKELTDEQRARANQVAEEVIREYEAASAGVHRNVGGPWLFGGDS